MRTAVIKKEDIILEAIHQVYENGLENFTPKKVSVACGISEGSVYHYFPNKQDLLRECMIYILKAADDSLREIPIDTENHRNNFYSLWNGFFHYYLDHKEQAFFHQTYRNSSFFPSGKQDDFMNFFPYLNEQVSQFHLEEKIPLELFWVFIVDNTLNFVLRVADGTLSDNGDDTIRYFNLLVQGIRGLFDSPSN